MPKNENKSGLKEDWEDSYAYKNKQMQDRAIKLFLAILVIIALLSVSVLAFKDFTKKKICADAYNVNMNFGMASGWKYKDLGDKFQCCDYDKKCSGKNCNPEIKCDTFER